MWRGDGTHIKDMEDPVEIQFPGSNCIFVVLREGVVGEFAQPLDVSSNAGDSPVIKDMISGLGITNIFAGTTHVVSCPMASSTDGLS